MRRKVLLIFGLVSMTILNFVCVSAFAECEGDLDCDSVVDGSDLSLFAPGRLLRPQVWKMFFPSRYPSLE
jgi:hypothetical protein